MMFTADDIRAADAALRVCWRSAAGDVASEALSAHVPAGMDLWLYMPPGPLRGLSVARVEGFPYRGGHTVWQLDPMVGFDAEGKIPLSPATSGCLIRAVEWADPQEEAKLQAATAERFGGFATALEAYKIARPNEAVYVNLRVAHHGGEAEAWAWDGDRFRRRPG